MKAIRQHQSLIWMAGWFGRKNYLISGIGLLLMFGCSQEYRTVGECARRIRPGQLGEDVQRLMPKQSFRLKLQVDVPYSTNAYMVSSNVAIELVYEFSDPQKQMTDRPPRICIYLNNSNRVSGIESSEKGWTPPLGFEFRTKVFRGSEVTE